MLGMTANPGEPQTTVPTTPQGRIPADTFSVRLLLSRHLSGLTIKEAADRSGINDATWATWEGGRRPRDLVDVCGRVAEALDIDFNWLLLGGPLLSARGRPTVRPPGTTRRYERTLFGQAAASTRPTSSRPKVRTDQHRPIQPASPGRRAVRVNPVSTADSPYTA
jgi:transcriptional regulator with XRE-family HTH domain